MPDAAEAVGEAEQHPSRPVPPGGQAPGPGAPGRVPRRHRVEPAGAAHRPGEEALLPGRLPQLQQERPFPGGAPDEVRRRPERRRQGALPGRPRRVPVRRLSAYAPEVDPGQTGAGPTEAEGLVRAVPVAAERPPGRAAPARRALGEGDRPRLPRQPGVGREEERNPGDAQEHGAVQVHRAVVGHALVRVIVRQPADAVGRRQRRAQQVSEDGVGAGAGRRGAGRPALRLSHVRPPASPAAAADAAPGAPQPGRSPARGSACRRR